MNAIGPLRMSERRRKRNDAATCNRDCKSHPVAAAQRNACARRARAIRRGSSPRSSPSRIPLAKMVTAFAPCAIASSNAASSFALATPSTTWSTVSGIAASDGKHRTPSTAS
jgi:hypothetical protein